ncbi:MAG: adenosylcobinamide-GDP ribazoletransferase [Anaerolineales bacterium]
MLRMPRKVFYLLRCVYDADMQLLLLAVGFLTAIPVTTEAPQPGDLGRAGRWFPLIGLCLGGMVAGAHWLLLQVFPPLLAATLTVALWAALTGGLHLDGLADCGDALLAAATPERRLEIMRDPRLGAFGVIALTLFLIAKVAAVSLIPAPSSLFAFVTAAVTARWLIVLAAQQPLARAGGMAAEFQSGLTRNTILLAALLPAALLIAGVLGPTRIALAIALAHVATFAVIAFARARLGGLTGDVFGLIVEVSELTVLLTFAAQFPPIP